MPGRSVGPIIYSPRIRVTRSSQRKGYAPTLPIVEIMQQIETDIRVKITEELAVIATQLAYEKMAAVIANGVLSRMTTRSPKFGQASERRQFVDQYLIAPVQESVLMATHRNGPARRIGKSIVYTGGMANSIGYTITREKVSFNISSASVGAPTVGVTQPEAFVVQLKAPTRGQRIGGVRFGRQTRFTTSTSQPLEEYVQLQEVGGKPTLSSDPKSADFQRLAAWAAYKLSANFADSTKAKPKGGTKRKGGRSAIYYGNVPSRVVYNIIHAINQRGIVGNNALNNAFKEVLPGAARGFFGALLRAPAGSGGLGSGAEDNTVYQAVGSILCKEIRSAINKLKGKRNRYEYRIT